MVLTFFFAQLLGLIMATTAISLLTQRRMYTHMITAFSENRASQFATSFVGLVLSSILVLTHNVWSGGMLPILVTLVSWLILIKSLALLILPTPLITRILKPFVVKRAFVISVSMLLIIGLYLFLAGSGGR